MDRRFVITGLIYAIAGMILGIHMSASKDHGQMVTHAHIMLVGFLLSFAYGLCHRLWLDARQDAWVWAQFGLHQVGALMMTLGLFLLYGRMVPLERIDPLLALSSFIVLAAMALMLYLFLRQPQAESAS